MDVRRAPPGPLMRSPMADIHEGRHRALELSLHLLKNYSYNASLQQSHEGEVRLPERSLVTSLSPFSATLSPRTPSPSFDFVVMATFSLPG